MLQQPETVTAEVVAVPVSAVSDAKMSIYESKASSLRRACVALILLSFFCARPWPTSAWLGVLGGCAFLSASSHNLLCRARVVRFLAAIVAFCSAWAFVSLATSMYYTDKPHDIAKEVHFQCAQMPEETFAWGQQIVTSHFANHHKCKGAAFLQRHFFPASDLVIDHSNETMNTTNPVDEPMSQEAACDKAEALVARFAQNFMFASALAHLLLFFTAAAVVKRACKLRCVAYKLGLLEWKCGCKCRTAASKPADEAPPAAKELA